MKNKIPENLILWWTAGHPGTKLLLPNQMLAYVKEYQAGQVRSKVRCVAIGLTLPVFIYSQYLSAGKEFNFWFIVNALVTGILFLILSVIVKVNTSLDPSAQFIIDSFLCDLNELYRIGQIPKSLIPQITDPDPQLKKDESLDYSARSRCAACMLSSLHELAISLTTCGEESLISYQLKRDFNRGVQLLERFQLTDEDFYPGLLYEPVGPAGIWS